MKRKMKHIGIWVCVALLGACHAVQNSNTDKVKQGTTIKDGMASKSILDSIGSTCSRGYFIVDVDKNYYNPSSSHIVETEALGYVTSKAYAEKGFDPHAFLGEQEGEAGGTPPTTTIGPIHIRFFANTEADNAFGSSRADVANMISITQDGKTKEDADSTHQIVASVDVEKQNTLKNYIYTSKDQGQDPDLNSEGLQASTPSHGVSPYNIFEFGNASIGYGTFTVAADVEDPANKIAPEVSLQQDTESAIKLAVAPELPTGAKTSFLRVQLRQASKPDRRTTPAVFTSIINDDLANSEGQIKVMVPSSMPVGLYEMKISRSYVYSSTIEGGDMCIESRASVDTLAKLSKKEAAK